MDSRTVTIRLELRVDGDAVSGRAVDGPGDGRSFSGWLGLIAALDALIAAPAPSAPATTQGDIQR